MGVRLSQRPQINAKGFIVAKEIKLPKGKEFTFKQAKGGRAAESRYDWDNWLSGKLLLLEQSTGTKGEKGEIVGEPEEKKDFEVSVNEFVGKAKTAARQRFKVVQVSRFDADGAPLKDAVIIKARDMDDDEKAAEELRRAEQKERNAARREERKQEGTTQAHAENAA